MAWQLNFLSVSWMRQRSPGHLPLGEAHWEESLEPAPPGSCIPLCQMHSPLGDGFASPNTLLILFRSNPCMDGPCMEWHLIVSENNWPLSQEGVTVMAMTCDLKEQL